METTKDMQIETKEGKRGCTRIKFQISYCILSRALQKAKKYKNHDRGNWRQSLTKTLKGMKLNNA